MFAFKVLFLFLGCFLITLPRTLFGTEMAMVQGEDVTILFDQGLAAGAEEALKIYPQIKGDLERVLKQQVTFAPTVILIKDTRAFQKMADSLFVVAFAIPQRNLMVIDYSKMNIDPFTMELTMKHELCHLLLYQIVKYGTIPKWLDEGIAQWVSAGMAEIVMSQKRSLLNEAILSGRNPNMRALEESFPRDKESLHLSYEASRSLIVYMVERFGVKCIISLLDRMRTEEPWEVAMRETLSISFDELERDWQRDLKKKLTWYTYLINNLYEILFFLAALMAMIGFLRAFIRKRAYMRQDDDGSGQSGDHA